MSDHIHITAHTDGTVTNAAVREALSALTATDVSDSSPVSAGAREVGTRFETEDGDVHLHLEVSGHEGDFTKTSHEALVNVVKNLDGVDAGSVSVEGGYDGSD